ncbi:MAG TPA: YciI family protein [Blastocatellia bacterium]|nr:YciI family protein [Blastocatellia bacterium]
MSRFMLLFRANPESYQSMSPEDMQQTVKKWMDWRADMEKSGHVVQYGERMEHTGKVIRGKSKTVTDGPYVEVKDFIQGSALIKARDIDEAVSIANGCPILDSNGSVEIRPIYNSQD